MNFFENAFEALDGSRHEVIHHAGYAIADLGQALETMRHDVSKCINPLTLKAIEELGKAAGHHASYAAGDIWKILHNAGDNLNTWAKPFIESIEASISGAGQNVHKYFVGAIANGETMDWTSLPAYITSWIEENPERTLGIIFNIILPVIVGSLAATAVPAILAAFGFTTEGILAGSIAARLHSGVGNVAANTLFSTLMSAGAAGAGLATVQMIVGGLSSVIAGAGAASNIVDLIGSANIAEGNVNEG